jgi:hypothetical protein
MVEISKYSTGVLDVSSEAIDDVTGNTEFSGSVAAFEVDTLLEKHQLFIKSRFKAQ